jgi:protease IV
MRPFLKQTLASTLGSVLGLTIFSGLSLLTTLLIFVGIVSTFGNSSTPAVKEKTILVLDLSANIADFNPGATLQQTFAGTSKKSLTVRSITEAIRAAAKDQNIVAIYLDGSKNSTTSGSSGLASLREVRNALSSFRQTGKVIYAYDADMSRKNYYLSSIANTIALNPLGTVDMNGFRTENLFYRGAFDKYGIGAEVIRVGKYKSAYESFSLKGFSPESRKENQELLNNLWSDYKSTIGGNRKIAPETIQKLADTDGTLSAKDALSQNLVDKIAYPDQVKTELLKIGVAGKNGNFRQVSMTDYSEIVAEKVPSSDRHVAVLYAQGTIVEGSGETGQIGGDSFVQDVIALRNDKSVKAVVLRVNSPGGSATASDRIQRELKLLSKEKPLVVSMGNVAASGGYYISTNAKRIFAQPNTITGSIGVIGLNLNFQKLASNQGLSWDVVKTSKFADSTTVSRPKTKEELAIAQKFVDQIYDEFLDRVAEGRNMSKEKVNEIAQGRVWSGVEAKKVGLVDELGGLEASITYAAKEAGLVSNWNVVEYPESEDFQSKLLKRLSGEELALLRQQSSPVDSVLTTEFNKLQATLSELKSLNDPRGVYARMTLDFKLD